MIAPRLRTLIAASGLALALSGGAMAAPPPAPASRERAVLDLERRLLQARVSTDTTTHRAHFAQDGVYVHSSGVLQDKAQVLHMVAERPWVAWSKTEQQVQVFADSAVTHSLLTVRLADQRTETVRATGVYVLQDGQWTQVSWQSSEGRFVGPAPGK